MSRTASPDARSRLVETADRLFYQHGIRAVGIDRVIAEAGVAKATLYAHFPTKDDLILAALQHREAAVTAFFAEASARHGGGLAGFFAALREWVADPRFRGCAFQNAAAEVADPAHPASVFVRDHKRRFHAGLGELVTQAGAPPAIAPAVALLVEGVFPQVALTGDPTAADEARNAALRLVRAGGGKKTAKD